MAILQLFAYKNQVLLVRQDVFLVLDFSSDGLNAVTSLNLEGDGLASEGLHKDLLGRLLHHLVKEILSVISIF